MSKKKQDHQFLLDMVEKILFGESELGVLKTLIQEVNLGKVSSKQLRTAIIESRIHAMDRILELFPFYHTRTSNQQEIERFTGDTDSELAQDLKEKNSFIEEIGLRIDKIVRKMYEKVKK